MVRDIARQRLRRASFLGALCAVAIGAAGCSSETSRFGGGNPNSNPYGGRASSYSTSYSGPPLAAPAPPAAPIGPARYAAVESEPLPQIQPAYSQPYGSQPYGPRYAATEYDQPQYGQPSRYEPPAPRYEPAAPRYEPPRQSYEPRPPRPAPDYSSAAGSGARLSDAGAPRAPAQPPSRVASTNARAPAASSAPPLAAPAPAPARAATPEQPAGSGQTLLPTPPVYTVAPGDTLGRVAHRYHVSPREIAIANGLTPEGPLRVGMRLTIPLRTPTFRPARPQVASPAVAQERPPADPHLPASTPSAVRVTEAPAAATIHLAAPVAPPVEAAPNGAPAFRWPARGRVINNYGARVNGSTNDGIDLAVPEGTPVRAADDGVVAYAGDELKGYGKLVLVRHANGFVTAYANGSELLVKRNDQVHKGQVILKSGQTGNAATPQLHFEIRKNSAPVDPMQYLPADRTASAPL
jgi:murein DD-endopeptidase MepM/ murein hydrolase activator NlpD